MASASEDLKEREMREINLIEDNEKLKEELLMVLGSLQTSMEECGILHKDDDKNVERMLELLRIHF